MQRTIYDFLCKKYDFINKREENSFIDKFQKSMKVYWGLKILAVATYFVLFLYFVGKDVYLPSETYWFIGSVFVGLFLVTLAYFHVFAAWFVITLSKHRKWIDNLLIISGLLLWMRLPIYTFGDAEITMHALREMLAILGVFLIAIGVYRKIHYQNSGIVQKSAICSVVISIGIFIQFPVDIIERSIYLGFIMLVNLGFLMDLVVFYYFHNQSKANFKSNSVYQMHQ